ncbi:hypothetical protein [Roseibium sediminis]|uniref:hypothetical protein n=1 Tax=Roseibium sediminis TaxID=1775174 RepID=UPI00123D05B2|nr:hypothetical protein [Roseibium sediminis]
MIKRVPYLAFFTAIGFLIGYIILNSAATSRNAAYLLLTFAAFTIFAKHAIMHFLTNRYKCQNINTLNYSRKENHNIINEKSLDELQSYIDVDASTITPLAQLTHLYIQHSNIQLTETPSLIQNIHFPTDETELCLEAAFVLRHKSGARKITFRGTPSDALINVEDIDERTGNVKKIRISQSINVETDNQRMRALRQLVSSFGAENQAN